MVLLIQQNNWTGLLGRLLVPDVDYGYEDEIICSDLWVHYGDGKILILLEKNTKCCQN
jgi:hypothetical protein